MLGVAVSGGPDSMCLLDILAKNLDPARLVVLNVEHGIRGEASKRDSAFVEEYARSRGLRFIGTAVNVPERRKASGRSEESEARIARREFFEERLACGDADFILTAHNAGDRTESILMHILRGSGGRGLTGPTEADGRFIRPLIGVTRGEIEEYNARENVPFVSDETNLVDEYSRNFLRLRVLPLLRERWNVDAALATLGENAARDERFISSLMDCEKYIRVGKGEAHLDISALSLDPALSGRYVIECAARLGRVTDLSAAHIAAVMNLAHAKNGKRVALGGGLTAAREYDRITLYNEDGEGNYTPAPFAMGLTPFGRGYVSITPCEPKAAAGKLRIDGDSVPQGAVIRTRAEGDIIVPFGGGRRKLKEFLIDKKIPLRKRDKIPLLCYNDRVLAVFGVEISREAAISERTAFALELDFTED